MKKIRLNSLFVKLSLSVIVVEILLAMLLFFTNIRSSEHIYTEMFSSAQEKIFEQIEGEFYDFYMDQLEICKSVAGNESVAEYLTMDESDATMAQKITYRMQRQVEQMKISEYDNTTLFLLGTNGRNYIYSHADLLSMTADEILSLTVTKAAAENPGTMVCKYMERGFTDTTKREPIVVTCQTIPGEDGEIIGYVYLATKEADIRELYDYFISGISDIVLFNSESEVISSNNSKYLYAEDSVLAHLKEIVAECRENRVYQMERTENHQSIIYLVHQFANTDFVIVGMVNAQRTFYEKYNMVRNILLVAGISLLSIIVISGLVRRQTGPIYRLVGNMRQQDGQNLNGHVPVEGTEEIQELSRTYNKMLDDLQLYIDRVVKTEQAKRSIELRALQMQINPHFIYNTLASIKWLILQGNAAGASESIDAFIALLRNTISNSDEFITIRQERCNLENYVTIIRTRYGNRVQVEFYIQEECYEAKIPKMVLQPFVENAFFHAFPVEQRGTINIFINQSDRRLHIEIADDGVGMTRERLNGMLYGEDKREHFTGIGVHNVDERLKLIYGMEYGVQIDSEEHCGTTVTVEIPFEKLETEKNPEI